jgi:PDZ domain-containing protein
MTSLELADRHRQPPTPASVPRSAEGWSEPPGRRRRIGAAVIAAGLLTAIVVVAAVLPVPYIALRPGSARPVTEQVLVEGAPSYPPEESIAYTTVHVGETSLLEAFLGWLDDDVDVLPEERVRGDRSEAENRRYNAQLMDNSKLVAIAVALQHLGHQVSIHTTGAIVRQIVDDSPAAEALQLDDVIVAVDGQPVDQPDEIGDLLQVGGPGAEHDLTIERPAGSGTTIEVPVETIAAPDDPTRAMIGIAPENRIVGFEFPVDVTIDSGNVGGPSAGLAFTLAVIDVLTPGELTGGHRVAVTGTMSLDGTVGPVGGGAQKAITVRDAGYEVFLVPSDELEEVKATVGGDLEVIAVDTLAEALEALDSLGGNARTLSGADGAGSP